MKTISFVIIIVGIMLSCCKNTKKQDEILESPLANEEVVVAPEGTEAELELKADGGFAIEDRVDDEEIMIKLKRFYESYITAASKTDVSFEKIDSLKNTYVTTRLLNELEKQELDYDPFLDAQDANIKWLETLVISKDSINDDIFFVSYTNSYDQEKTTIALKIVLDEGEYKIDSVGY